MICAASQSFLLVKRQIDISTLSIACSHVKILEVLNGLSLINQESADHDSTSIDHGIMRSAELIEDWSIENHTTWLLTDILVNIITTALLHIQIINVSIGDNLADRLHGELASEISKLTELAIS